MKESKSYKAMLVKTTNPNFTDLEGTTNTLVVALDYSALFGYNFHTSIVLDIKEVDDTLELSTLNSLYVFKILEVL